MQSEGVGAIGFFEHGCPPFAQQRHQKLRLVALSSTHHILAMDGFFQHGMKQRLTDDAPVYGPNQNRIAPSARLSFLSSSPVIGGEPHGVQ